MVNVLFRKAGELLRILGLLFFLPAGASAMQGGLDYGIQVRGVVSSEGVMPFWLHANRYDEIDRGGSGLATNLYGRWSGRIGDQINITTGTDILLRRSQNPDFRIQEGYVQFGYDGRFNIFAGRKRTQFGLVHPDLSLGSMDWSANTRPVTQFSFFTDGLQEVPGSRGHVFYDARLSHGWKNDDRWVDQTLIHQKSLYLRVFDEDFPVMLNGGVSHIAQWGGESPQHGVHPSGLREYANVFFALASDSKELIEGGHLSNSFQNHLGIYDFALDINLDAARVTISRQFYLEDTPNARFAAPWDGIWGVDIIRKNPQILSFLEELVYEHVYTLGQLTHDPRREGFTAQYYNHANYRSGWTFHNRIIGNPLYDTDDEHLGVVHNEIVAHHLGLGGRVGPVQYRTFGTYSRSYGAQRIYDTEGERLNGNINRQDQYSFMLETEIPLGTNTQIKTTLAADIGERYPDNIGIMVGFQWNSN